VAASSSWTGTFAPTSQWYLTAAIEKILATRTDGASLGISADVLIPVDTESATARNPRTRALTSNTLRFGIVLRW
jgi:hypothetical protein